MLGEVRRESQSVADGYPFPPTCFLGLLADMRHQIPVELPFAGLPELADLHSLTSLSTLVHKFGNVFRYATRARASGRGSSFFRRSVRSDRVKCHAKGVARL